MKVESSIVDRAWPAWVWSPQDRSIVAANDMARTLWKLAPTTSTTGFLFPAKAKVTKRLHGAAIALLAGAEQVQIDIKLPFAKRETWQCRRLKSDEYPDGVLLLEAPQLASEKSNASTALEQIVGDHKRDSLWSDDAFNALAVPILMLAGDGNILHLNEEAQRLAPSDLLNEAVGDLWTRPTQFRHFFSDHAETDYALEALAEAHRTGSASFIAGLKGVPGFPGGRCQILIQRIGKEYERAPLMVTFHKLARLQNIEGSVLPEGMEDPLQNLYRELAREGILAFELGLEDRVVFFTPQFADWLGKPAEDVGGRRIADIGLTPATGGAIMQLTASDWVDGRYMIRRLDGSISSVDIRSIPLGFEITSAHRRVSKRLCIAKVADAQDFGAADFKEASLETVLAQAGPYPTQSETQPPMTLAPSPFVPDHDEDVATAESDENNLVRLDDWREGDDMVLTGGSFQALIDGLDVALMGLDKKGRILFLNAPTAKLLEKEADDLRGHALSDFLTSKDRKKVGAFIKLPEGRSGSDFTAGVKVTFTDSEADERQVTLRLHALRERSPIKFCAFLRSTNETASETAGRAAPGGKPKTDDDKSSKRRADFVARVSHEIRTPLNAILGFSDLILSESMGPIGNDKYKEYMNDIRDSGKLILSLVNDILDLAKAEAQAISVELKGMNVEASMRRVASILSRQAETHEIRLSINIAHPLPVILADERSVMQILLNLVSNAIKFSKPGDEVLISARPHDKDHVALMVTDTGVGMTEEDLERALSPYEQTETNDLVDDQGKKVGTGLGLPISKALAEANRAEFRIESARDKGTRVQILFNRARVAAE